MLKIVINSGSLQTRRSGPPQLLRIVPTIGRYHFNEGMIWGQRAKISEHKWRKLDKDFPPHFTVVFWSVRKDVAGFDKLSGERLSEEGLYVFKVSSPYVVYQRDERHHAYCGWILIVYTDISFSYPYFFGEGNLIESRNNRLSRLQRFSERNGPHIRFRCEFP